jgi:hypothetical protein
MPVDDVGVEEVDGYETVFCLRKGDEELNSLVGPEEVLK